MRCISVYIVSIPQAVSTVATDEAVYQEDRFGVPVSIPQAVSTVATFSYLELHLASTDGFNTASGKYCCNLISISSADVIKSFNTASGKYCCNQLLLQTSVGLCSRFNTASGKYCCNIKSLGIDSGLYQVSIPQAVSTVATAVGDPFLSSDRICFNTASGKYCCNWQ